MVLTQRLLTLLSAQDYIPETEEYFKDLFAKEGISANELRAAFQELLQQGVIAIIKKNRYILAKDADLVAGTIRFKASGSALLIPDSYDALPLKWKEPLLVTANNTLNAFNGDRVLAKFFCKHERNRPSVLQARVKHIIQRKRTRVTGTLSKQRFTTFLVADDPAFVHKIQIDPESLKAITPAAQPGDKIVVQLYPWEDANCPPEGAALENLGPTHTPKAELQALLQRYDLKTTFPQAVLDEVNSFPPKLSHEDFKGRLDCRNLHTLTIDPEDAQDFDDALSVKQLPNDCVEIGVHIADVSYYVRQDSQLDKSALERGNSTYLAGCMVPMIPHALSQRLCSLLEDEPRLAKSIFFRFTPQGEISDIEMANTVIQIDKRLSYKQAQILLTEDLETALNHLPEPLAHQTAATGKPLSALSKEDLGRIQGSIKALWRIASILRKKRMQAGSLDLDMPEIRILLDPEGNVETVYKTLHYASHQLVEEFMLLANETVAKHFLDQGTPFISRVHEDPRPEKLIELQEKLAASFNLRSGNLSDKKRVSAFLQSVQKHSQAYLIRVYLLRSLQQARYDSQPLGHYGLAKKHYAHFTSPIRRYADLINHRVWDQWLFKHVGNSKKLAPETEAYTAKRLKQIAYNISLTERNSLEAEREYTKIKLLEFLEKQTDNKTRTPLPAVIIELRNHAICIELLDTLIYGMIHLSTLEDDFYTLNATSTVLRSRKGKKTFTLGQEIEVLVDRVDRFKRQVDFILA